MNVTLILRVLDLTEKQGSIGLSSEKPNRASTDKSHTEPQVSQRSLLAVSPSPPSLSLSLSLSSDGIPVEDDEEKVINLDQYVQ